MSRKPANPFLDAAQKRLDQQDTQRNQVQDTLRQAQQSRQGQTDFCNTHLVPLINQLRALPEKNGRCFELTRQDFTLDEVNPRMILTLEYRGGEVIRNTNRGGGIRGPALRDAVTLIVDSFADANDFSIRVVREDQYEGEGRRSHKATRVNSVEDLHAALGDFAATVAPDRMAELGADAPAEQPQERAEIAHDLWDQVGKTLEGFMDVEPVAPQQKQQPRRPRGRR